MTLRQVLEKIVADAFSAGAQWRAIADGVDSATIRPGRWAQEHTYQRLLAQRQRAAVDELGWAIVRVKLEPEKDQATLF